MMFASAPMSDDKKPAGIKPKAPVREISVDSVVAKLPAQREPVVTAKQVSFDDRPTNHRTQLGMPAVISTTVIETKETGESAPAEAPSHDRFTFNDMDFANLDTTVAAAPAEPHYGMISDDEKTQPGYVNPEKLDAEKSTPPPPAISTPPAPLPTPNARKSKLLFIVPAAILAVGTAVFAAIFFFSGEKPAAESPPVRTASIAKTPQAPANPVPAAPEPTAVPAPTAVSAPEPAPIPEPAAEAVISPSTSPEPAPETAPITAPPPQIEPKPEVAPKPESIKKAQAKTPGKEPPAITDGDTVRITLTGRLNGAEIKMNGTPVETTFTVPRSDKAVKVEVHRPGYAPAVKRIVPGQDKSVFISMKK